MATRFLLFCAAASLLRAQSQGTFTPTGSMTTSRESHTATLLWNGKVLIAGGVYLGPLGPPAGGILKDAEIYDPGAGIFSGTGAMTTPRSGHTATLLADGKVRITGGAGGDTTLTSAELYDPATGAFSRTGDMTQPRAFHTAALMPDGRVLIAGNAIPESVLTAEFYDPLTQSFSPAGSLSFSAYQLTVFADGRVLIQGSADDYTTSAALYDPRTSTFTTTGPAGMIPFNPPRNTSLLASGQVLDIDLDDGCGDPDDSVGIYDPASGTFAEERMVVERRNASATMLSDATVLIAGGGTVNTPPLLWAVWATNGAEIYDPVANTFTATGSLNGNREGHSATLLQDGSVLVAGGWGFDLGSIAEAEIYHPSRTVPPPALLTLSGDGSGGAAVLHGSTQQVVSPSNPASAGEVLEIYATGLLNASVVPPLVSIGGRVAELLFFGKAPGYDGLNQINARVPAGLTASSAAPVRLRYLDRFSNQVTLAIQ
jgi:large repetitive protein